MRGAMDRSPSAHVAASCWTDQMGVLPSLQAALYSDHVRDGSKGDGLTPSNPRRNFRSTSVSRPSGTETPAPLPKPAISDVAATADAQGPCARLRKNSQR